MFLNCVFWNRTFAPILFPIYSDGKWEVHSMKRKRVYLNESEWRHIIHSLNALRTKMIQAGQYTDVVDETLMKVINAPIRKVKVS